MNANRWQQGWVRPTVVVLAGLSVGWLGVGPAQADYIPMDTVYSYHDSGTGGAYLNCTEDLDLYIPSGELPGPYGGWYDGNPSAYAPMSPGHPGYPFQFRNKAADIPLYIFDTEPGGYVVTGAGAASYLRMDSLHLQNGGTGGTAIRPPYDPNPPYVPNPPTGYTSYTSFWTGTATGEMPGFPGITTAVDFLSLPGDPNQKGAGNSYVVVGVAGKGIDPAGTGADIFIQSVYQESPVEKANLYVTNDLINFTLVGTLGETILGTPHSTGYSWLMDYYVDLANGITGPVLAIKIEGLDLEGGSPGFDLASVQVSSGSLVPWQQVVIPEPGSGVLLALGMLGFWAWRMRGSARPKKI